MDKTQYILRSFRKIQHKPWELFIISGIVHGLNDDEVQFITQQYVRRQGGSYFLTDLFFPQLSIHLEVDERYHDGTRAKKFDDAREKDIIDITNHEIRRIKTYYKVENGQRVDKSLERIRQEIRLFINYIKLRKSDMIARGIFTAWEVEKMYDPQKFIEKGYLDVSDNVALRYQIDAMKCFGFTGSGWQRGGWRIQDGTNDVLWFPRLYRYGSWTNSIEQNGTIIYEKAEDENGIKSIKNQKKEMLSGKTNYVITFARVKDPMGENLFRYVGTFKPNMNESSDNCIRFDRYRTREPVRLPVR